ncbi:MAG: hypothetical protein ACLPX5_17175 [Dissulfurispiraceae bacterium]
MTKALLEGDELDSPRIMGGDVLPQQLLVLMTEEFSTKRFEHLKGTSSPPSSIIEMHTASSEIVLTPDNPQTRKNQTFEKSSLKQAARIFGIGALFSSNLVANLPLECLCFFRKSIN